MTYTTDAITEDCTVTANLILLGDGSVDLVDVIVALQVVTGVTAETIDIDADVNGDGKIGVEEAIYAMRVVGGL